MAILDGGGSAANKVNVDANFQLAVGLTTSPALAGYVQQSYVPIAGLPRTQRITVNGSGYVSVPTSVMALSFNSSQTTWAPLINTMATTMTRAPTAGFMRLNASLSMAANVGVSVTTVALVPCTRASETRVRTVVRTLGGVTASKQIDIGVGLYPVAAGQSAAMAEFAGFRWTQSGTLQGVVETSAGGAAVSTTIAIPGGVPSDNVAREYEVVLNADRVEFWVDRIMLASIVIGSDVYAVFKARAYPWCARLFHSAAPASLVLVDIGSVDVVVLGSDVVDVGTAAASQQRSSVYLPPDVFTASSPMANSVPASASAPTAVVTSNVVAALASTFLGGAFRLNPVGALALNQVNWATGFANPAVSSAVGAAANARALRVTSIAISPLVVTTALIGGGVTAQWLVGIGGTALAGPPVDADGATALATRAPRLFVFPLISVLAAAAAVGAVSTQIGDAQLLLPSPLFLQPGEFLQIGLRPLSVAAAHTGGTIDGAVFVNGDWT